LGKSFISSSRAATARKARQVQQQMEKPLVTGRGQGGQQGQAQYQCGPGAEEHVLQKTVAEEFRRAHGRGQQKVYLRGEIKGGERGDQIAEEQHQKEGQKGGGQQPEQQGLAQLLQRQQVDEDPMEQKITAHQKDGQGEQVRPQLQPASPAGGEDLGSRGLEQGGYQVERQVHSTFS
jgi:hypothetical protein